MISCQEAVRGFALAPPPTVLQRREPPSTLSSMTMFVDRILASHFQTAFKTGDTAHLRGSSLATEPVLPSTLQNSSFRPQNRAVPLHHESANCCTEVPSQQHDTFPKASTYEIVARIGRGKRTRTKHTLLVRRKARSCGIASTFLRIIQNGLKGIVLLDGLLYANFKSLRGLRALFLHPSRYLVSCAQPLGPSRKYGVCFGNQMYIQTGLVL
ncbi:hypothetical protein C8F01DRAFT_429242 [Mycena amicta]|nr:hypothetical protein C8F01DRAFT_429242 [Mycena amicta]